MQLLIDAGNSRIKWAVCNSGVLDEMHACDHRGKDIPRFLKAQLPAGLPVNAIWVSNVVGNALVRPLNEWADQAYGISPRYPRSLSQACGVINAYSEPGRLGIDRWLSLIAIHQRDRQAACILDCGTAITLDVISASGQHLGGTIMPGIEAMRRALTATTQLGSPEPSGELPLFGHSTEACINAGIHYSVTALLDRVLNQATRLLGEPPQCVITGGNSNALIPLLGKIAYRYEPDIVLQGLAWISQNEQ